MKTSSCQVDLHFIRYMSCLCRELTKQRAKKKRSMESYSKICEFYKSQAVFITGGTGFVGKALIAKLLNSCCDVKTIYILLRDSPNGKTTRQRFEEFLNIEVFDNMRKEKPELLMKLVPISGDVTLPELGISREDRQLLIDDVSIVFHCAARVRFDENLKEALDSNVKGPKRMAELCHEMKHLKVFVHVSTTYNNLDKAEVDEIIYPTNVDPLKLVDLADTMDKQLLKEFVKPLIGSSPNVYAYTKALGEQVVLRESRRMNGLPLLVIRPSTITPALKEPLPGWTDNMNAAMGISFGIGKGFLRCVPAGHDTIGDMIPVDYVVNLIIAAAWKQSTYKRGEVKVYNSATGTLNPITWGEFRDDVMETWEKYPTKSMMWYPTVGLYKNKFAFLMMAFLSHLIPAFMIDTAMKLQGKKPFLGRMYQRAHVVMSALSFYTIRQWKFLTRNSIELYESMSAEEKEMFYFDVRDIIWKSYLETFVIGVRQYLLKDNLDTLAEARRNLKRMYYLRLVFRLILFGLLTVFFVKLFEFTSPPADFLTSPDDIWSIPASSIGA